MGLSGYCKARAKPVRNNYLVATDQQRTRSWERALLFVWGPLFGVCSGVEHALAQHLILLSSQRPFEPSSGLLKVSVKGDPMSMF